MTFVNRTDRLYAIVEELRAVAPRCRSARQLAARFEVSARTIERDISALQQSGVPVYAEPGRRGGYALEKSMSLPPLNFTSAEAVAVAVALGRARDNPFAGHAHSALRKLVAAMSPSEGAGARALAARVHMVAEPEPYPRVSRVIERSLLHRRVLRLRYEDQKGRTTVREVEPTIFVGGRGGHWYLVGMCRLREDVRVFRLDRIAWAEETDETAPEHPPELFAPDIPGITTWNPKLD
ncbi:putative DNA-binding transcriptional regulator YafY [Streptosporangium becharense]|uniref:Putative DNA-binding transcriptional regulator YafY n=1 Tax=Streptosporangium becharense TaxID=1816182 RepID=A0A7W9MJ32_9ACTN|nr:WYL domain-containing protein [Streptosporangium becharense]MBB2913238.1 putative DNA-binding transcriptional regulator YafY [Streptosporangium becharense]MBB5822221.1 putative DNA-binding transcriptional regulator YafY [Streptosporangium becharense]